MMVAAGGVVILHILNVHYDRGGYDETDQYSLVSLMFVIVVLHPSNI